MVIMVSKIWFKIPNKNGYKWLKWFEERVERAFRIKPKAELLNGFNGFQNLV